jgi:hypothetical protein
MRNAPDKNATGVWSLPQRKSVRILDEQLDEGQHS